VPSWIPLYPGVTPTRNFTAEGGEQATGKVQLQHQRRRRLHAELLGRPRRTRDPGRTLTVMASTQAAGVDVVVTFTEKR
jgi:hypothetical protein